jgi:sarcosine oxidase subunit beta
MADFVIVGGGVYGCGVAWELAKRGADVTLLEAKTVASGASGGLGKRGVRANGRDLRELPLMRLAYEMWPALHEAINAPTGYERIGHLLLIEREHDYAAAEAQGWMQSQQGIPSRLVLPDELRELEPMLSEEIQAAILCPLDGVADHTATTQGLAQAAGNLGAQIRAMTPVTALERQTERVTAVITAAGERIPVGRSLLLLANQSVPGLLQTEFGIKLPVWSLLPQVVLTKPVEPMPLHHLIGHAHRTLALKAVPGNRIMISGGWRGQWNAALERGETQPDQVEGNRAEAVAVYSALAEVPVAEAAADRLETVAIDGIPIIDQLPGFDNLFFACGWSGHGWAIAPAVNQLLAEWVYSGQPSDLLKPFSYRRFLT